MVKLCCILKYGFSMISQTTANASLHISDTISFFKKNFYLKIAKWKHNCSMYSQSLVKQMKIPQSVLSSIHKTLVQHPPTVRHWTLNKSQIRNE